MEVSVVQVGAVQVVTQELVVTQVEAAVIHVVVQVVLEELVVQAVEEEMVQMAQQLSW